MYQMSQTAVFHLHKIERMIRNMTQKRFRLSNAEDIDELLIRAASSSQKELHTALNQFVAHCHPDSQRQVGELLRLN
ncbi:MAG: hypothetical protein MI864_17630 [Pseudomonadales bacterium]|nr:hypothetical protein [Pseudomonadales bacterium]